VIESARRVTGVNFPVAYGPRRPGDPAILFANADKIRRELGWSAGYTEIGPHRGHGVEVVQNHPGGYGADA